MNINKHELILLFLNYINKNETLFKKIDEKYILYLRGILNKELRLNYFKDNKFSIIDRVQQPNQFVEYEINAKKYLGIIHHVQMFAAEYAYYLIHVSFYKITSSIEMMLSLFFRRQSMEMFMFLVTIYSFPIDLIIVCISKHRLVLSI